ncbi:SET domain-containing protein-lysine N-methyltransferase [Salmonella enterica]|nr:SET domain-containing protein-lysine N-methyltransferase [Salmonella enterica]EJS8563863.1 SET domain-containing protein-lysine N-methyltransferase [Salmonella enterica]EJS8568716.1 SET domain-containing protein-lysine N-methyltransferase [Salmonella enterica]
MRGIGAVIHFRSPTPGSTSVPDFSGMWSSIRDWFSLSAQDEAAQYFRAFYQPDEGMSPPDRLKHFLRLKALASPGRQANFTAERILGTGETICMIASGKNSDFPSVTLHLSDQEWHSTQHQKEAVDSPRSSVSDDNQTATATGTGGSVEARPKGSPITRTQIQAWQELSPEAKCETGGWKVWAQTQGINIGSAGAFLTNTGLTPRGTIRLQPPGERGSSITNAQIQVWRDLPQEAKREAGGWKVWAQTQGINIGSAGACLTNTGLTHRGAVRLQPPGERGSSITNAQIQVWRDLPQEAKREAGGWKVWAQTQGINIGSAGACLTNTGLKPFGIERLKPPGERGTPIINMQIQAWQNLPLEAKREAGGWMTWAQAQGISIGSAVTFLTNSGLTSFGTERLKPPGERGTPITNQQIRAWQELSQEARNLAGGCIKWAQAQGINIGSTRIFLTNSGLTPFGTERLKPPGERGTSITNQQIRTWRDLPPEEKHMAGGWMTWAQSQGIDISSASVYLTNTGLKPQGVVRLQPPGERGSPITEAQLLAWLNMSPEERRTSGGWAIWAQTRGISYISARKYLAPTDSEMPSRGTSRPSPPSTVTSGSPQASTSAAATTGDEIAVSMSAPPEHSGEKRSPPSTKEDISAPPAKQIKEEEDDVTWRTHQINNNLPILRHWRNPAISVMAQAEGRIETLQVTRWGPLFNLLSRQTKARINQDIRWFLQNEGSHDARMNAMMSVAIPLDDSDGYRGRTVYARTDLAAFTVLGPYSGRLLDSEKVRCEYEKEYGKEAGNYYFATRSQERLVSAWPEGNILSLINSPAFTHRTAETEARQNVSAVLVGKNIHFYVTTRDISAGEELWFDYGPDYRHFESGEALRSAQVKEEPSSPEEG